MKNDSIAYSLAMYHLTIFPFREFLSDLMKFSIKSSPVNRHSSLHKFCFLILFFILTSSSAQADSRLERAYEDYQAETRQLIDDLTELRVQAAQLTDRELVTEIDLKLALLSGEKEQLNTLPRKIRPEIRFDLPPKERDLHVKFRQDCEKYAQELYLLARRTQTTSPTFAFELINLLLQFDSDHTSARLMRGYVRQGEEWMTTFERDKLRNKEVDHPRFGWIKQDDVARYEAGERNLGNAWLSAEKEALLILIEAGISKPNIFRSKRTSVWKKGWNWVANWRRFTIISFPHLPPSTIPPLKSDSYLIPPTAARKPAVSGMKCITSVRRKNMSNGSSAEFHKSR